MFVNPRRSVAVVLFLVAILSLAASRAFPFMDNLPGLLEAAVVLLGAVCALAGAYLWLLKSPDSKA
jgi:hypothetical protein